MEQGQNEKIETREWDEVDFGSFGLGAAGREREGGRKAAWLLCTPHSFKSNIQVDPTTFQITCNRPPSCVESYSRVKKGVEARVNQNCLKQSAQAALLLASPAHEATTAAAAAKTPVKQQRQHGNRKTAMTAMAPPIFSYANHDSDQRCETLLRRQSARRDPVSPFPAVFFLCNSAVAALYLVLEIFFYSWPTSRSTLSNPIRWISSDHAN
ncbi:hypothetical protein MRB53_025633 [Persea americana]|uniref:Uncharacterized protein n=1 Tax=Persea americana TaxID=3435 RepID=A0ACC2LGR9_PERAE|nr:hypothetical protein MRB53_025633 [Persea americana]